MRRFSIISPIEKIATDIYTFSELRKNGFTYVDKTDALYAMASGEVGKQFFIARPRRFGKSLAVSTLKSLFLGERELFRGLAIEPKWDWSKKWPVLHLDMGSAQTSAVAELRSKWRDMLKDESRRNGIPFLDDENPATAFKNVIEALVEKSDDGQMVLLIDEYDKPLLGHLMNPDVTEFRDALKAFFFDIPYDMTDRQNEQMWQTICYVVLRSIGVNVNGVVKTHDGRMDMVVDLPSDVYIIEFKLDRPASEALEQIRGKDYAGKYALSGKRITLVGISFSSEKRAIVVFMLYS